LERHRAVLFAWMRIDIDEMEFRLNDRKTARFQRL